MDKICFSNATFNKSCNTSLDLPIDKGCEIAFAGRSNAGKSSVINVVTNQKNLARTSKTPGRTQLINYFKVSEHFHLVDLPGYGYAKVPLKLKKDWHKNINSYLVKRKSLVGLVIVMDIRRPLNETDIQLIEWCYNSNLLIHIVLNKSDKIKYGEAKSTLLKITHYLKENNYQLATVQLFSVLKRQGLEALHLKLESWVNT